MTTPMISIAGLWKRVVDDHEPRLSNEELRALLDAVEAAQVALKNNGSPYVPTSEIPPGLPSGPMNILADKLAPFRSGR